MKFFRIIGWFFRAIESYDREKEKFVKYGYVGKCARLLVLLLFVAFAGLCAYGSIWIFKTLADTTLELVSIILAILKIIGGLCLGYLAIGMIFQTAVLWIQNMALGFGSARSSKTISDRVDEKIADSIENAIGDNSDAKTDAVEENKEKRKGKTSKGFNIFYGIFCIVGLAILAGVVVLAFIL